MWSGTEVQKWIDEQFNLARRGGTNSAKGPDPYTTRGFMADEPKNWSEG